MAAVSDVVGELESAKGQLEAARATVDNAGSKTDEMIGQAQAMELSAAVEGMRELRGQIDALLEQVSQLSGTVDAVITAAGAIREAGS
jgi:polyhydroxyalkanoate synthesis regulator phasin